MNSSVCVDASFLIKLIITEPGSNEARALWRAWISQRITVFAPALLPFEAMSTVRKQVQRGTMSEELGNQTIITLTEVLKFVHLMRPRDLIERAWKLGQLYGLTVLYDASYVALAEVLDTDLWTGDGRMLRSMPQHAGRIRVLNPQT